MQTLNNDYENGKISLEKLNQIYFRLPLEYQATEWAIYFLLNNKEKCKDFLRKVNETIDFS